MLEEVHSAEQSKMLNQCASLCYGE